MFNIEYTKLKLMYDKNKRKVDRLLMARGLNRRLSTSDRTTKEDLLNIWKELQNDYPELKSKELEVIWDYKYDIKKHFNKPVIINIGNGLTVGGTHWTAIYKSAYFDSYGLAPPSILYEAGWSGTYNTKQIQALTSGGCGQMAISWLSYVVRNKENEFFNLFK